MSNEWREVPDEVIPIWTRIFTRQPISLVHLSDLCPACGERKLYRYFQVASPTPILINGRKMQGRGSLWEWCAGCWLYAHYSAAVPVEWVPPFSVDDLRLTPVPDNINGLMEQLNPGAN